VDNELQKRRIAEQQEQYGVEPTTPEEREPGVEEGDWLDYLISPASLIRRSGKSLMRRVGESTTNAAKKGMSDKMRDSGPPPPAPQKTIDYTNQNIARRPTYTDTSGAGGVNIGKKRLERDY
jgi:hypothetical protein